VQGHFSSHTLAETLRDLYLAERTGVLRLSRGEVTKEICFERGMIVSAASRSEDEDLGRCLVREGRVSSGALAEARRSITDSRDLAQALVNRGLVSKATLSHTARRIAEQVVESVFRWEGGTTEFTEGTPSVVLDTDILLTFEVILKGIGTMADFGPIQESMRSLKSRVRIRQPAPVPLERLALSPAHGFILSRADGTTTVQDILSILPPGEEDLACRFLYALLVMGILVYEAPVSEGPFRLSGILRNQADQIALEALQERLVAEALEGLPAKTPFQVLGIAPGSPPHAVEQAYEEAKQRFGRDTILPRVREKLRAELSILEARLVEAFLTLSEKRAPAGAVPAVDAGSARDAKDVDGGLVRLEVDKTRTKVTLEENARVAEAYHAKARKYVRDGDYHNAIQYGKLAISYNPEDARFYFLLAECHGRNPEGRWQRMAEQHYLKATELDPWNADYRVSLGRFYKRRGLNLRARKQFELALKIAPGLAEAAGEIASLRSLA